jgi:transcription elongation factor GreA
MPEQEPIVVSRQTLDKMQAELKELTTAGRAEMAERIQRAREMGDLKENSEYHSAKDAQGMMEARIRQIQTLLDSAVIVEGDKESDQVGTGSIVALRYDGDDDVERYLVGSIEERPDDLPVISPASPLGQSLLGRSRGDTVEYQAPSGTLKVEIVEVSA